MESTTHRPVEPVRPVAPWVGGKRNLAKRLVAIIQATPHTAYAEPFVGMGGVFLRRTTSPGCEIVNDASRDIANLFRILQRHYPQFIEVLRFGLTVRAEFERLSRTDPSTLTDLERAARFLYLQNAAFGGKVVGQNFGVALDRPARFDLARIGPMLEDLHSRLTRVTIENLDYGDFIKRYDREGVLFYCDPPYFGTEHYYGKDLFNRDDFARMATLLRELKGRFILSINDAPEIRELFAWARIQPVQHSYHVSGGATEARELIISSC